MVNYRSLPDPYANPLHDAAHKCRKSDVEFLRRLLASPRFRALDPIDMRDKEKHTAVHALCSYEGPQPCREDDRNAEDVEACLQLLVEAGADLEARDLIGCTPLQDVAWSSDRLGTKATLRLTSLLLRHGANVNKSKLRLPARPARLVAEYWLHAGFYLSPPPPPAKCDRKGGGKKKKAGKKKK